MYLIIVALQLLKYMRQGASYNQFGAKLGQCYITDADHVWLSDWVGKKKS